MMNITEQIAATHLGKKSVGSELYDKSLLVAVPRKENRTQYSINEENLPFIGYDIWHAYEVSFLTTKNIPCMYVLTIKYPSTSLNIVESKSLKLYLNSFNMTPLKDTIKESEDYFLYTVKKDLDELLKTSIDLKLHKSFTSTESKMFPDFINLNELVDFESVECTEFKEDPKLLEYDSANSNKIFKLNFSELRSNCRVTHQPDFGDAFILIKSEKGVKIDSLLKYLVSFRSEWHFHEECCEMIYKRLLDKYNPSDLMVGCLYTRRGGIDICPIRANKPELLDSELLDISKYTRRTIKQ